MILLKSTRQDKRIQAALTTLISYLTVNTESEHLSFHSLPSEELLCVIMHNKVQS